MAAHTPFPAGILLFLAIAIPTTRIIEVRRRLVRLFSLRGGWLGKLRPRTRLATTTTTTTPASMYLNVAVDIRLALSESLSPAGATVEAVVVVEIRRHRRGGP